MNNIDSIIDYSNLKSYLISVIFYITPFIFCYFVFNIFNYILGYDKFLSTLVSVMLFSLMLLLILYKLTDVDKYKIKEELYRKKYYKKLNMPGYKKFIRFNIFTFSFVLGIIINTSEVYLYTISHVVILLVILSSVTVIRSFKKEGIILEDDYSHISLVKYGKRIEKIPIRDIESLKVENDNMILKWDNKEVVKENIKNASALKEKINQLRTFTNL